MSNILAKNKHIEPFSPELSPEPEIRSPKESLPAEIINRIKRSVKHKSGPPIIPPKPHSSTLKRKPRSIRIHDAGNLYGHTKLQLILGGHKSGQVSHYSHSNEFV